MWQTVTSGVYSICEFVRGREDNLVWEGRNWGISSWSLFYNSLCVVRLAQFLANEVSPLCSRLHPWACFFLLEANREKILMMDHLMRRGRHFVNRHNPCKSSEETTNCILCTVVKLGCSGRNFQVSIGSCRDNQGSYVGLTCQLAEEGVAYGYSLVGWQWL